MAPVELSGKVVVVPMELAGLATRMAARGATVVLVGPDAGALGELAGEIEAAGAGRPAVFVSDGSDGSLDALAAFLSEMFRAPPASAGECNQ
jgi:NAD(P)-dependent dehydrogenase (short-subunit alcohol dehydrogenase family)